MTTEKERLFNMRVPAECLFCRSIDDTQWTEFEVYLADRILYDAATGERTVSGASIRVFCTNCEEEIRKEDICNCQPSNYGAFGEHVDDCPARR